MRPTTSVAAVLACHNRRDSTVRCLQSLADQAIFAQSGPHAPALSVSLLDDGSTDGTAEAVREIVPGATILHGDGSCFWCGGMRIAWAEATKSNPDFFLLLNDDTTLDSHALEDLLRIVGSPKSLVIGVGAVRDPASGEKSYGGTYEADLPYPPADARPRQCLLFNANCVLVPRAVFERIGMFHSAYTHAIGDMDYSHEARRNDIRLLETPRFVGSCARNKSANTWMDNSLSRLQRFRLLNSPKGLPYREWWIFCRRNCGRQWLRYFLAPTTRILLGK